VTRPVRFPFDPVEQYIRIRHPDPNGNRQAQAETGGGINAAVWLADVLQVDRRKILAWRVHGALYFDCDTIATTLGLHAASLWPEWAAIDVEVPLWRLLREEALAESVALRTPVDAHTAA